MTIIEWRSEFSVGIASVDYEHQILIALINELHEILVPASAGGSPGHGDCCSGALARVHASVSAHFALEETVMRDRRYPGLDGHKADHELLLNDIRDIMESYERGNYEDSRTQLADRVSAWFSHHFRTFDAPLHAILPSN
ncbi:MAG: hemerythrin domain-containing protein [Rhodospirillaceae bacterium]